MDSVTVLGTRTGERISWSSSNPTGPNVPPSLRGSGSIGYGAALRVNERSAADSASNDFGFIPPSLPQGFVDFMAGLGDGILLGRGDELRDWLGVDGGVDPLSTEYGIGYTTGFAEVAIVASFTRVRIGIDGPHHYFPALGQRLPHVQMDAWLKGVSNSGVNVFRIPFPTSWYGP
jgi:hypothetical protein